MNLFRHYKIIAIWPVIISVIRINETMKALYKIKESKLMSFYLNKNAWISFILNLPFKNITNVALNLEEVPTKCLGL